MKSVDNITFIGREIASSKIKYEVLDELFKAHKIRQNHIVFHIDMIAVMCRCYNHGSWSTDSMSRVSVNQMCLTMVVEIMNVIAHYRKYLTFKLCKANTIIVTYDTALSEYQSTIYPELRRERMNMYGEDHPTFGMMNQAMRMAYEYVKTLCVYFDDIYCIDRDCGVDTVTIMALLLNDKRYNKSYHILFTRNLIAGQLCKNGVCAILYNKRADSVLLTEDTIMVDGYCKLNGRKASSRTVQIIKSNNIGVSMIPYILMLTSTDKILPMVKGLNWSFQDGIEVIAQLFSKNLITNGVSILSFLDAMEQVSTDMNKSTKASRGRTKKKKLNMSPEFRKMAKEYNKKHRIADIDRVVPEVSDQHEFTLTDDVYKELINRYRVVSVSITLAAVTKQQIMRIYGRMYNLFNQEYLEKINDMLAELGPDSNLIEISALNANTPNQYSVSQYSENEW